MKRILPNKVYKGLPCSVVAVGCAMGIDDKAEAKELLAEAREGAFGGGRLQADGYLSLRGMNALIRGHKAVTGRVDYKRGQRPCLRDFCHSYSGKAVVCLLGHFIYVEGGNYYSYFFNGDDPVVSVWCLD